MFRRCKCSSIIWGGETDLIPLAQVPGTRTVLNQSMPKQWKDSYTYRGSSLTYHDRDLPYQQFHGVSLLMWLAKPIFDASPASSFATGQGGSRARPAPCAGRPWCLSQHHPPLRAFLLKWRQFSLLNLVLYMHLPPAPRMPRAYLGEQGPQAHRAS